LALRTRKPHGDLVVVADVLVPVAAFASPSYAAKLPKGYKLADVDWIAWSAPYTQVSPNPELAAMIPGFRPVFTSDNYLVQWRAAEAGVGAMILGRLTHPFARQTGLVPLDLDL